MAQEATVPEDTAFNPNDEDEMEEMRDDAIDLYEKSLEKEEEMREEEDRKNSGTGQFKSYGRLPRYEQDDFRQRGFIFWAQVFRKRRWSKVSSNPWWTKSNPQERNIKHGRRRSHSGQTIRHDRGNGQWKKVFSKIIRFNGGKERRRGITFRCRAQTQTKSKGNEKGFSQTAETRPNRSNGKTPTQTQEKNNEKITTRRGRSTTYGYTHRKSEERGNRPSSQNTKKHRKNPTPKRMEILNVEGEQPPRTRPKAKASASSSSSSAPAQPTQEEGQQEPKGVKKTIQKEHGAKVVIPSKAGIQVMREEFENGHNKQLTGHTKTFSNNGSPPRRRKKRNDWKKWDKCIKKNSIQNLKARAIDNIA